MKKAYSFEDFMDIIRKLRSKDGCPWDREQTHESLKQCLIEECYEAIEAIDNKDYKNLCEELGDILLQVAMHSVIAEEEGVFTVNDVISDESDKMIRRHPHVFGEGSANTSEEVLKNWENIKDKEKKDINLKEELLSIPRAFPANIRAEKVLKKAVKHGLNPGNVSDIIDDITSSLSELKKDYELGEKSRIFDEYGSVLLKMIKLSLVLQINAENSLTNATNKFINRHIDNVYLNG
ncbi:tetrapyrrole methylase family protein/MazG family protein [Herbinix hemicellulosilytica]|uniref:NTP pyrophosphohydrolase MazG-like domain-containing protein n=1 Tax=Herbinix hemicellulosilytica TaxID=1564487 RepID=A0A0H5SIM5_HERHM|nr:nucleoside triphosphate pyrophosphohydrolase [Herbinix hemicellulosilytica]RBP59200.1 tetrapyrrole methylase family protein/MazG family protein [Herbinix hemicellulosilytica]CRZ35357.1 hypothetical protein HHT355_2160 [Herbinix hemicellulosilytica]